MKISGIYLIRNKINDKIYIGQSLDINNRLYKHKYHLKNNTHTNSYLQSSFKKYGEKNFEFKKLFELDNELEDVQFVQFLLDELEILAIKELKTLIQENGFNIQYGGNSGRHNEETKKKLRDINLGKVHSEESKKKMSESRKGMIAWNKGKKMNFDTSRNVKISKALKGKEKTLEHKLKLSESKIGKSLSDETKEKISSANKGEKNHFFGKKHSDETRKVLREKNGKKVICITTNKIFNSLKEASEYYNCDRGGIGKCCNGKIQYFSKIKNEDGEIVKLQWRFLDEQ